MSNHFKHSVLNLNSDKMFVYTAISKHYFYYRMFISKFVLENNKIPFNPFMTFDYFLLDTVERNIIREANNNLVKRADEFWAFGPISDGFLAEIQIAKSSEIPITYFEIRDSKNIVAIPLKKVRLEDSVKDLRKKL